MDKILHNRKQNRRLAELVESLNWTAYTTKQGAKEFCTELETFCSYGMDFIASIVHNGTLIDFAEKLQDYYERGGKPLGYISER